MKQHGEHFLETVEEQVKHIEEMRQTQKKVLLDQRVRGELTEDEMTKRLKQNDTEMDSWIENLEQQARLKQLRREFPSGGYLSDIPAGERVSMTWLQKITGTPPIVLFSYGIYSYRDATRNQFNHVKYCEEYIAEIRLTYSCLRRVEKKNTKAEMHRNDNTSEAK